MDEKQLKKELAIMIFLIVGIFIYAFTDKVYTQPESVSVPGLPSEGILPSGGGLQISGMIVSNLSWASFINWLFAIILIILLIILYLKILKIRGIDSFAVGSKEEIAREIKLVKVKLDMIEEDMKKRELTWQTYSKRRMDVLSSLRKLKSEIEGNNLDKEREPFYMIEARKAVQRARILGYDQDKTVDMFVKKGWDRDFVLRLCGEEGL